MRRFVDVDPATLHLPGSRRDGADPAKLHRQIAKYGRSLVGMPPPYVYECSDGRYQIYNGVTRATRAAKLCPGTLITVEVLGTLKSPCGSTPTVKDKLP